jgi:outer membrane protein with beta-barrel domain
MTRPPETTAGFRRIVLIHAITRITTLRIPVARKQHKVCTRGPMTNAGIFGQLMKLAIGAFTLLASPMAELAAAQNRPRPTVEIAAGWVGFADDSIASESLVGGAVRLYLLPRISVGPEIAYIHGKNHSHLMVTGNLTCDLLSPTTNGRLRRVSPFVVAGGGLFQTREDFFNETFTSSEGAFTAGGGVRALVRDRVTVGVEARIGWELHLRINGLVGLQLGR